MSLVPYSSRDSREIVLRHNDAIVIRDPQSNQLILRGAAANLTECPYCHQTLRSKSPEREPTIGQHRQDSFVSPEYFRMLHLTTDVNSDDEPHSPPSSPIRRLTQLTSSSPRVSTPDPIRDAEFITSSPAPPEFLESQGIKRDAFSPNYFKKFFIEERELGRGGKGVVILVRHELDGVFLGHFACKRVPVGDDHGWLEKVLIEVQLLQRLSHPNLVSYRHVWLEDVKLNRFGPSVPCAFILQQYCNAGDLLHYVVGTGGEKKNSNERLKEQMRRRSRGQMERPLDLRPAQRKLAFEEIYSFFKDITSGLAHLHAANYIHRDLKPSNCLLHKSGNDFRCLISDFGEVQAENLIRKSTGATGTISYCAPEVLRKDASGRYGNFSTKSDVFSLGMILYFLCFGRLPYSSAENIQEEFEDLDQLRAEISTWSGFQDERKERPELPDQLYEFLKRLLALDPAERPNAEEILVAIKTGSGLASPPRIGRQVPINTNISLGKRIQPIDTPVSGTPEPTSRRTTRSSTRAQASRKDDFESIPNGIQVPAQESDLDLDHYEDQDPNRDHDLIDSEGPLVAPTPALLMAPPTTPMRNLTTQIHILQHRATTWLERNSPLMTFILKLLLFLLKTYALTTPCQPLAVNPLVAYPLLLLAALDLALGLGGDGGSDGGMRSSQPQWHLSVVLTLVHFGGVLLAGRGGVLCVAGRSTGLREWDD